MAENALTKVARIAAGSAMGATYKDKDGKQQVIKPTGDANYLDLSGVITNSGSSSDGGGTNPDNPSAGADYYAGSLADGEITERYLLYQRDESVAEQTGSQTVTLLRDVGTKFNMAGDGATFLIHLQKTAMTKGAKGSVTDIELNYDPNNVAKDGYFTTTSPYPVYTKSADLATKKTLAIPINGIGENLSGKNVKAPQLNVTFNGDGTMTFESVTGYDNDGNSAGATGANYEVVVDAIATFSVQSAVQQLPSSINLFTGSAEENIVLSGMSKFFENSMDGIEITFGDRIQNTVFNDFVLAADVGSTRQIRISKEKLIDGIRLKNLTNYSFNSSNGLRVYYSEVTGQPQAENGVSWTPTRITNNFVTINDGSLSIKSSLRGNLFKFGSSAAGEREFDLQIVKVTPYKD